MCCFTSASHTLPGIKHPNIVAPTIPNWNKITIYIRFMTCKICDSDVKQHIANMMTVITTSTFALYAAEK